MTFTIRSAAYANPNQTAAIMTTDEAGAVLVSKADKPELWAAMLEHGEPAPFVPPPVETGDEDDAAARRKRIGSLKTIADVKAYLVERDAPSTP